MTALCPGGGAAQLIPGKAAIVDYSAGLLAAIFAAYDLVWLIPVIPFVGLAPLVLNTFCGSDPPPVRVLTAAETDALLNAKFGTAFQSGLSKVTDLVLNTIWHNPCQCFTATEPALPPQPPPAG